MAHCRQTRCRSENATVPMPRRAWLLTATVTGALMLSSVVAQAAMHDAETCRKLKAEHDSMNASGLREMLAKGPDWAKSNLTKERLEQIKRFLSLEEDVRFRCPLGKARPELEAAESEAGATTALQPGEAAPGAPAGAPAPAATAKPARKARPPAKAASTEAEAQGSGSAGAGTGSKPAAAAPAKAAAKKQPAASAPDNAAALQGEAAADTARKKPH